MRAVFIDENTVLLPTKLTKSSTTFKKLSFLWGWIHLHSFTRMDLAAQLYLDGSGCRTLPGWIQLHTFTWIDLAAYLYLGWIHLHSFTWMDPAAPFTWMDPAAHL